MVCVSLTCFEADKAPDIFYLFLPLSWDLYVRDDSRDFFFFFQILTKMTWLDFLGGGLKVINIKLIHQQGKNWPLFNLYSVVIILHILVVSIWWH